jgi:hypothetical protein
MAMCGREIREVFQRYRIDNRQARSCNGKTTAKEPAPTHNAESLT